MFDVVEKQVIPERELHHHSLPTGRYLLDGQGRSKEA
jgi:hypothetical protein